MRHLRRSAEVYVQRGTERVRVDHVVIMDSTSATAIAVKMAGLQPNERAVAVQYYTLPTPRYIVVVESDQNT